MTFLDKIGEIRVESTIKLKGLRNTPGMTSRE